MSASILPPVDGGIRRALSDRGFAHQASQLRLKARVYLNYLLHLMRQGARRALNLPGLLAPQQLEVELDSPKVGLFGQINWCVKLAAAAETHGRRIHFVCTSRNYSPNGGDWLGGVVCQRIRRRTRWPWLKIRLNDLNDFPFPNDPALTLTLAQAREVFERTFSFPAEVIAAVRTLLSAIPVERTLIGVHYRGTDKSCEAQRVPYETVLAALEKLAAELAVRGERTALCYYVATDETSFVAAMRQRFGQSNVFEHPQCERSADGRAMHLSVALSLQRARDAMIDTLVLSACPILLRTSSFLSGWAAVLARKQFVVMLNEPFAGTSWFPDCELAKVSYREDTLGALAERYVRDGPSRANTASTELGWSLA